MLERTLRLVGGGDVARNPMEEYASAARMRVAETFGLSRRGLRRGDKIWAECPVGPQQLLEQDVRDEFKGRALAILLAPDLAHPPFPFKGERGHCVPHPENFKPEQLPEPLRTLACDLLELSVNAALALDAERHCNALPALCLLVRHLLRTLPEHHPSAARLFACSPLRDRHTQDHPSAFDFYRYLMNEEDTPEQWMRLADEQMRWLIGKDPLALEAYVSSLCFGAATNRYGQELIRSQLDFLLNLPNPSGSNLFWGHHLWIFNAISKDPCDRERRYRFARHVVFVSNPDHEAMSANSLAGLTIAQAALREFGETDPELGARLREIIARGEASVRNAEEMAQKKRQKAKDALARMR